MTAGDVRAEVERLAAGQQHPVNHGMERRRLWCDSRERGDRLGGDLGLLRGDATVFFTRPISLGMLLVAFALLIMVIVPQFRKKRDEVITEGES